MHARACARPSVSWPGGAGAWRRAGGEEDGILTTGSFNERKRKKERRKARTYVRVSPAGEEPADGLRLNSTELLDATTYSMFDPLPSNISSRLDFRRPVLRSHVLNKILGVSLCVCAQGSVSELNLAAE